MVEIVLGGQSNGADVSRGKLCVHHWEIDPPFGEFSDGRCVNDGCRETRRFKNRLEIETNVERQIWRGFHARKSSQIIKQDDNSLKVNPSETYE